MNPLRVCCSRVFQKTLFLFSLAYPYKKQAKIQSAEGVGVLLREKGIKRPFVIAGPTTSEHPETKKILSFCAISEAKPVLYCRKGINPEASSIAAMKEEYLASHCDAIISIGGGSSIDSAKALAVALANPNKPFDKMAGLLKAKGPFPFHIAIPTTAGSGSESSVATVLTGDDHRKYAITTPALLPDAYLLDGQFLMNSPEKLLSETGMDCYCHALEAYLGNSKTKKSKTKALLALKIVDENLRTLVFGKRTLELCDYVLAASNLAGQAFSKSYVGYVHALAHAVGGKTNQPHGLLIAILLPYVLDAYGDKIAERLAYLSDLLSLTDKDKSIAEKAYVYRDHLEALEKELGIPKKIKSADLTEADIPALAKLASKEANPLYPVPKELDEGELESILKEAISL